MIENSQSRLYEIEKIEKKYLDKYYHFLKFAEDEMFFGFRTKEDIKSDWFGLYGSEDGKGISDFAVGAERVVYALLNGKGIGQPNSSPVGSDLFFEVDDAYIHIDMKTVQRENIGDYTNSIFVGRNQNSYKGTMSVSGGAREYIPALPTYYNKGTEKEKICLTYFISILYDKETLDILVISIECMPNGELEEYYKGRVLKAGKNLDKARFNIKEVNKFEILGDNSRRVRVIYFNEGMDENTMSKLKFFKDLYMLEA